MGLAGRTYNVCGIQRALEKESADCGCAQSCEGHS